MSSEALAWAFKQDAKPSSAKFVLVAMAECAHYQTGKIFPSVKHLVEITGLNRKTIISSIDALEKAGFIRDTGERAGKTAQVKVYAACIETVPKTEQSQKRNSPKISRKQSQKRDTEPSREPSLKEPSGSLGNSVPELLPAHVVEAWNLMAERKGLPKVKLLTAQRTKHLKARIRDYAIDDFTDAISAIERSRWLCGENDRGWKADFDFLLQPKSFTKLIEGSYDN